MAASALRSFSAAHPQSMHVQAPASLLTPNLHIMVCRLPRQEAIRGNAAQERELWMEREMGNYRGPQVNKTTSDPEKSNLRNQQATGSALAVLRAQYDLETVYDPPRDNTPCEWKMSLAGLEMKPDTPSLAYGVDAGLATQCVECIVRILDPEGCCGIYDVQPGHNQAMHVLDACTLTVFRQCHVRGFKFDSTHATSLSRRSRSYQNSFVKVLTSDVYRLNVLPCGLVERFSRTARADGKSHGHPIAQIHCFLTFELGGREEAFALVYMLQNCLNNTIVGTPTTSADVPGNVAAGDLCIMRVERFQAQLLMLQHHGDIRRDKLRFLCCPGKLHYLWPE